MAGPLVCTDNLATAASHDFAECDQLAELTPLLLQDGQARRHDDAVVLRAEHRERGHAA